jgi:hypothetical protein
MLTVISRSTSNSANGRASGRTLDIGSPPARMFVSIVMPHAGDGPAMQPGIPVTLMSLAGPAGTRAARMLPAGGIAASSVNEDSGTDLLRFLPWCKNLLVKICEY